MRKAVRTAPYGIAPRVYCAANPLRYTDTTGLRLLIKLSDSEKYEWKELNGEWGFYNSDGDLYTGSDNGIEQYTLALLELMETPTGDELVKDVVGLPHTIILKYDKKNTNASASVIRWSNNQKDEKSVYTHEGLSYDAVCNLGHELAHILCNWTYPDGVGVWFNSADRNGTTIPISNSEIFATHYENKIRTERQLPLRRQYIFREIIQQQTSEL